MYQILCALVATIAYGTATGHCQDLSGRHHRGHVSIFHLRRHAPASGARGERSGDGEGQSRLSRTAEGSLSRRGRVHTLAGYRDANEGYVAAKLREAGFATLTYDGFSARGTTGAALSASPGYLPIGVADAYAALGLFRASPDRRRAQSIIGFSYGGEVAHMTAFETLRSALNPDRAGLPRTSHFILPGLLARSPNPVPIPALPC